MPRSALYIHSLGTVSAAGIGLQELRQTLFGQHSSAMRFHTGLAPEQGLLLRILVRSDTFAEQQPHGNALGTLFGANV